MTKPGRIYQSIAILSAAIVCVGFAWEGADFIGRGIFFACCTMGFAFAALGADN